MEIVRTNYGVRLRMDDTSQNRAWILSQSTNLVNWTPLRTNGGYYLYSARVTNMAIGQRFFRFTEYEGPPFFDYGVEKFEAPPFVELQAGVAGALPLEFRWYRDATDLGPGGSFGTHAYTSLPTFTWRDNGSYRLVARNRFGSVTSSPIVVNLPIPSFAPQTIRGKTIEVGVTSATFPFAAPALYRIKIAATGTSYVLDGLVGVPDGRGTYSYTRENGVDATAVFNDSLTGLSNATLTFESQTEGRFQLVKPGLGGKADGRFVFVQ